MLPSENFEIKFYNWQISRLPAISPSGETMPSKKMTREEFIRQSNIIHSYKYNYNKFEFGNTKIKGIIICDKHGEFELCPNAHIQGELGCRDCFLEQRILENFENFLTKAKNKYDSKYNYDEFIYIHGEKKGKIFCPIEEHGFLSRLLIIICVVMVAHYVPN